MKTMEFLIRIHDLTHHKNHSCQHREIAGETVPVCSNSYLYQLKPFITVITNPWSVSSSGKRSISMLVQSLQWDLGP